MSETAPSPVKPRPLSSMPGEKGLPLIGDIVRFGKDQRTYIERLRRDHGPVARLRFGPTDWVVVCEPELVHEITVSRWGEFHKPAVNRQVFEQFLGYGVVSSDGDHWKRMHKLMMPAFHRQRIDAYAAVMSEYTGQMLDSWQTGATRDFQDDMTELTLRIVAKTMFDADVQADAKSFGEAMKVVQRVLVAHINFPVPVPRWWPGPVNRRKQKAIANIERIVMGVVEDRRRTGDDKGDLLSTLVHARDEAGKGMSDRELRDEAMTLFFAGHETTANALTWCWYLLGKNPEAVARAKEEVDRVLGGRAPTTADLDKLVYVEQVFKESLRLLPSVWVYMRETANDLELGGYLLPKGTALFISPYLLGRDERFFADPLRFDPDRFTKENERKLPRGAYVPFSAGPRVCMGKQFAMMEARIVLAMLLQRFTPTNPAGYEPEIVCELSMLPKGGLPTIVAPREKAQPVEASNA